MTNCPRDDVRDRLPDLLNERLDAAARAEVARHVASCPECAAELELLRSMRSALAPAPNVDVARIAAAVAASRGARASSPDVRPLVPRRPASGARRIAWRIAAAFVVAALGVGSWAIMHRQSGPDVVIGDHFPAPGSKPVAAAPDFAANQATPAHPSPSAKPSASPQMVASTGHRGLVMDGGVNDLSDGDVRMLLQSLDSLTTIPDADPVPVAYPIDDDGGVR